MATQLISTPAIPDYTHDSRWERIDGQWVERPVPGNVHAEVQLNMVLLLRKAVQELPGKALQEWSITRPDQANSEDPDYMTPDVLLAFEPYRVNQRRHLIPPGFLAVEVVSPDQTGLYKKAQRYFDWGVEHVWIIDPQERECFEYHGGDQFRFATDALHAGPITVFVADVFAGIGG